MNHQEIRNLFAQTISPDGTKRKQAEEALLELEKNINFILSLPQSYMKDTDPTVKKVSTIFFKNAIERNWNQEFFSQAKEMLMANIVSLMLESDQSVMNYYFTILKFIFENEKVEALTPIFNKIPECIFDNNPLHNYIGINIMLTIQENDNLRYNTAIVHPMVNNLSTKTAEKLLFYLENRNYMMAKFIMKYFTKFGRQYQSPSVYSDMNFYPMIFNLCKKIILLQEVDDIELIKLVKWAMRFINKGTEKAFKKFHKSPEIIAMITQEESIKEVYHSAKVIIHNYMVNNVDYEKTISAALEYVLLLCNNKKYTPLVLEDFYFFINTLILKKFTFGDKEEMDYEVPDSFLREKHSFYISNLKNLSGNFLDEAAKKLSKKKEEFNKYVDYLKNILYNFLSNPTEDNARLAYGALHMVAMSSHWIIEFYQKEIFSFLKDFIFPFLGCKYNFLKGQACYVLQYFSGEEITDGSIKIAFENVYGMLLTDDDILKVDAIQCMNFFFYNETVKDDLKRVIPEIIKILIILNNKYDLETLAETNEQLIGNYAAEVAQFGPSLVQALSEIVKNILNGEHKDKIDIISGHLRTIETLFSTITQKEILIPMFAQYYPLIVFILDSNFEDFYQEIIDTLSSLVFNLKFVDVTLWNLFEKILSLDKNQLYNNVLEISNLIELYIQYGKNHILSDNLFAKVMSFIQSVCSPALDDFFQDDYNAGCRIIECLILYSDNYLSCNIEDFINIVIKNKGFFERDSSCWVYCLNVIMHCYAINAEVTENVLHGLNFFNDFLNKLYEKRRLFKRVHDKKTVLLFIGLISTKPYIKTDYLRLTKVFVNSLKTLPSAITKRNTLMSKKDDYDPDDYLSNEDEMLEEDVYFQTKLDEFDAFGFIKKTFENLDQNTIGYHIIQSLDDSQREIISKIFSSEQPIQIK